VEEKRVRYVHFRAGIVAGTIVLNIFSIVDAQEEGQKRLSASDFRVQIKTIVEKSDLNEIQYLDLVKQAGPVSNSVLRDSLGHPNSAVRKASIMGLRLMKASCDEAADEVSKRLVDEDKWVRREALFYLGTTECQKSGAVRLLLGREKDDDVKKTAIDYLGRMGDASDYPRLTQIYEDPQSPILLRLSAVRSLIMLRGPYDKDFLLATLDNSDSRAVIGALQALEYSSETSIQSKLKELGKRRDDVSKKASIVYESIELNRPDKPLRQKEESLFTLLNNGPDFLQKWAAYRIIERFKNEETIRRLREIALEKTPSASQAAFMALEDKGLMTRTELGE
jgi:HEAT repeat protein